MFTGESGHCREAEEWGQWNRTEERGPCFNGPIDCTETAQEWAQGMKPTNRAKRPRLDRRRENARRRSACERGNFPRGAQIEVESGQHQPTSIADRGCSGEDCGAVYLATRGEGQRAVRERGRGGGLVWSRIDFRRRSTRDVCGAGGYLFFSQTTLISFSTALNSRSAVMSSAWRSLASAAANASARASDPAAL